MQRARRRVIVRAAAGIAVVGAAWWGVSAADDAGWLDANAVPVADDVARAMLTDVKRWDAATSGERRGVAERVERSLAAEGAGFTLLRVRPFGFDDHRHDIAVFVHATTGLEFSLIPGGTFTMGSPEAEQGREHNETQHEVTLTRPFLLARTECTQAACEQVMGANPMWLRGERIPKDRASWDDATAFCTKAGLRLPTEAEWEYACRAGTTTTYWSGDSESDVKRVGWVREIPGTSLLERTLASVMRRTLPVGKFPPVAQLPANPFGLHDVHGNVPEWCADWYGAYPAAPVTDPAGPAAAWVRAVRGGSRSDSAWSARSAARFMLDPGALSARVGFRPARSVTP